MNESTIASESLRQASSLAAAESADLRQLSKRIVVAQAWASAFLLLLWPLLNLWHPTQFRWHATVHALSAVGMVVFGSYAGHQAIYLLRGAASRLPTIRRLILWCVGLSALVVISGNWAYMPYRGVGGARQRLLDSAPFFQNVVMEFKEFICLLPLPLYIGAAFLLYYYGQQSARDQRVAAVIGVLLIAAWAFLMAGAVMGMSIAKVQFL